MATQSARWKGSWLFAIMSLAGRFCVMITTLKRGYQHLWADEAEMDAIFSQ